MIRRANVMFLRKEFRPSLQVSRLRLNESHCLVYAHLSPEQKLNFVFGKRTELACVRLEPNVRSPIRSSHPMRKPMIKLSRGLVRIGRVAVGTEDRIFLGSRDAARAVSVRYTCKRRVHIARRQGRVRYSAKAAGLVDVDLPTVLLSRGEARCQQECHGDKDVRRRTLAH
jgi:hypothetical protein